MRRLIALAVAAGLLVAAPSASAYRYHPPLGPRTAEQDALKFLQKYPGWRYREAGYLDCRFGRLNRYTRACRVGWVKGGNCWRGRLRVENVLLERGVTHYVVHFRSKRC